MGKSVDTTEKSAFRVKLPTVKSDLLKTKEGLAPKVTKFYRCLHGGGGGVGTPSSGVDSFFPNLSMSKVKKNREKVYCVTRQNCLL